MIKLTFLATAITISLTACAANDLANNSAKNTTKLETNVPAVVNATQAVGVENNDIITLNKIMSDPDWMGRSPESWYWGDDNQTVFYQQKREGNPIRDLYKLKTNKPNESTQIKLAEMHVAADSGAVINKTGTHEAYSFEGNVFVKELSTGQVKQLTHTSAYETSVMFLNNGQVAYQVGNVFYSQDLKTNQIKELANLSASDAPENIQEPSAYLAKEQHTLIDYIALQHKNAKLKEQEQHQLTKQNSTINNATFYVGNGNKVVWTSLSPTGDKLLISVAKDEPRNDKSDIMPNYIADDGHIKAQSVRARVADNRQYSEELFYLDLTTGEKHALSYKTLPGFDEDVLASVRAENYARDGKKYESKKSPRNIHVLSMYDAIKWSADGKNVAVMLEAWDNKDRWLSTVDFTKHKLVSQHRLHDDAWINWSFNEFGWLNNSANNTLYYLSEESGYSHLYLKALDGKAKALTSGNFEVSDVVFTSGYSNADARFVFKANVKHPGIYEIYQVSLGGELTALTDLNGMSNYSLSPDGKTLLIEHSKTTMPPELYVQAATKGAEATRLTYTVSDEFLAMPWTAPKVVAVPSSHQEQPIYAKIYLPKNSNDGEKRRAVMFSHGAGYLQNSDLGWSGYFREFMFHSMLVQQGYVVIDIDYRASQGYGRDWRTAIYRQMGTPEVQDMVDGVNWLVENENVDKNRIGTYGGSYGGFLTLMSMFNEPELFQSGSALRLVSDWAYYNHGYTSNILNMPGDDAIAYERSSPIYFAEGLQKPLLINAPMVDDNVFFQDTVRLVQRLIELEKENFETAIYPVEPHGFVQPSSWLNEYRRIYKLFEETL